MKRIHHRLLFSVLLLLVTSAATTVFGQITPSQDSYTNTATATTNYGNAATLGVASTAASIQTTYIKFDLSSIPAGYTSANIAKATLKLYVNSVTTAGSFNVDYVNGTWVEKTITSNLAPAWGTTIASNVALTTTSANNYIQIDVTPAIGEWLSGSQANDGVALVANSGLSATFDSKENGNQSHPAELDIVFTGGGNGTITGVTAGTGLQGGGTSGKVGLSLLKSCSTNQVLQWNGSAWVCASMSGTGTITGVTAGTGLTGGGTTGAVALKLDTTKVPLLSGNNTFTGTQAINNQVQITSSNGPYAVSVNGNGNVGGIFGDTNWSVGAGVVGFNGALSGTAAGVNGEVVSPAGYGVTGSNLATTGTGAGVFGSAASPGAAGVLGTGSTGVLGNGVIGVEGLASSTASGYGVYGDGGSSGTGVYGYSANGAGVSGVSAGGSTAGISGVNSASGFGVVGQAIGSSGQGVWGESFATSWSNGAGPDGVHGITHSNQGTGVSGTNTDQNGIGVWGSDPKGYGFVTDSHVSQARTMGGWAKAMAYVDFTGKIYRCFNSQLAGSAASTTPCGITVTTAVNTDGTYFDFVDFGFEVDDRFVMVTFGYLDNGNEGYYLASDFGEYSARPSPSQVLVFDNTFRVPSAASSFYVIVF